MIHAYEAQDIRYTECTRRLCISAIGRKTWVVDCPFFNLINIYTFEYQGMPGLEVGEEICSRKKRCRTGKTGLRKLVTACVPSLWTYMCMSHLQLGVG